MDHEKEKQVLNGLINKVMWRLNQVEGAKAIYLLNSLDFNDIDINPVK